VLRGNKVGPILFKNLKINGVVVRNAEQLTKAGFDISVPVKFEP
jgi:hypothetical protein